MQDHISNADKIARERATPCHVGPITMAVGGRTDHIPMHVLEGSYVLPADIVSGLGEGNTLAGSKVVDNMFGHKDHDHAGRAHRATGGGMASKKAAANLKNLSTLPEDINLGVSGRDYTGSDLIAQGFGSGPFGISQKAPTFSSLSTPTMPSDIPSLSTILKMSQIGNPPPKEEARGGPIMSGHYRPVPIVAAGGEYVIHPDVVRKLGNGDMDKGHNYLDHFVKYVRKHLIKTLSKLPGPRRD